MTTPAPPMGDVYFADADAGCPPQFERCIDAENARVLLTNIIYLRTYATEAETLCYSPPDAGAP